MDEYSHQDMSEYQMSEVAESAKPSQPFWRRNDIKAQKNGPHRSIYWDKKGGNSKKNCHYIGDWKENKKDGFGIQINKYQKTSQSGKFDKAKNYGPNTKKDKYEGMWANNMKHGQGTYWRDEGGKLKREYTGDWIEDKRHGRGTFFYKNGDRYDGFWVQGKPQGEGRIIYANQDIYEGQWHEGKKSGYGVLVKKNGDHYEGHWVNDKREGQGSYLFAEKNKLFVGEWVDDHPRCGIYTEVQDDEAIPRPEKPHFSDDYFMPSLPGLKLENPTEVLESAMNKTKNERSKYRAQYIPIDEMFTPEELENLQHAFDTVAQGESEVNMLSLKTLFAEMAMFPSDDNLAELLKSLGKEVDDDEISFELFARAVAILLEDANNLKENSDRHAGEDNESPMKSGHESELNMEEYNQEYQEEYPEEYNDGYQQQYSNYDENEENSNYPEEMSDM